MHGLCLRLRFALQILLFIGCASAAHAEAVLNDWCFNVNGDTSACNPATPATLPANVDAHAFDLTLNDPPGTANQLGTVQVTLSPGNNQSVIAYMDYDLNWAHAGSFQDVASVHGTLPTGITYELADPTSTIFGDFFSGALTNTNLAGNGSAPPGPCCDVGWALGVSGINVTPGSTLKLYYIVSTTQPTSDFYLQQTNLQDGESIYLSARLSAVPLPATWELLCSALSLLVAVGYCRPRSRSVEFERSAAVTAY